MQKNSLTHYFFILATLFLVNISFFAADPLMVGAIGGGLLLLGGLLGLFFKSKFIEETATIFEERLLFEGGPLVIFRWQATDGWPVEYVSPNIKTIFGFDTSDFYSGTLPFADLIHPDDLSRIFKKVMDYSANEKITTFEQVYRLKHFNGEYRWISDFTMVIRNEQKEITHYHGYIVDITERREAEEAFFEERRRLSTLIEALPDAIFLKDGEGRWQVVNSAGLKLFNLQNQPWQNKTDLELGAMFPEASEVYQACKDGDERAWQAARTVQIEEIVPTEDNNFLYFDVIKVPLFDEHNNRQSLVIIGRDVTDRKQAEIEMARLFHQNELLLNAVGDGIYGIDLSGKTIFVNPAATTLTGWDRNALLNEDSHALMHHTHADGCAYPLEKCPIYLTCRDGEMRRVTDEVFWRRDGSFFPVEYTVSPIIENDKPTGAVVVFRDITARHEADIALQQAVKAADAANRAKSEFLANMSHEIRTPMNAIIGMTSILLDTPLSDNQRDYLGTLRASSETLLIIINDILDLSKIEARKLELEKNPFELRKCVEESLDLIAPLAAQKNLNLSYFMELDVPEILVGDITRLRQILVNLLTNAVKFTHQGEVQLSISATASEQDYYTEQEESHLHFSIKDTGIGISSEGLQRLFRSFSQVDTSTTRKYGGTGLGLTISKYLVEMMGGQITVESKVDLGTTFTFDIYLPIDTTQSSQYQQLHHFHANLQTKPILLKDIAQTNLHIIFNWFKKWDIAYEISDDYSNEWAMIITENETLDQMPYLSKNIPIILIDKFCHQHSKQRFKYCLIKPIKPLKLLQLLETICNSNCFEKENAIEMIDDPVVIPIQKQHLHILLVEDNIVNQKVALLMLQRLGYEANIANNGIEALQALQHHNYDVVLMDVQMPEMDGLTATRHIVKTYPPEMRPYIIAMTANAMEGDREICLTAGMQDYISKPIHKEDLNKALNHAQLQLKIK
ncbi:MAG: hypothetical protein RIT27_1436 [Pseudomonadota bacterium]|jgi:PAS domain S-box-containing protein